MDLAVTAAWAVAEARLRADLTVPAAAVDAVDPRDALSPLAWVLATSAGVAPRVSRVVPLDDAPRSRFAVELDAPLVPGAVYQLGLAPLTRSAQGEPTDPTPVVLVGRALEAATAAIVEAAADVALPARVARGDLVGVDRLTALRERYERMLSTRKGAFTHAPDWGRGLEAKRTYNDDSLREEQQRVEAALEGDDDVRRYEIRTRKDGHLTQMEVLIEPTFEASPILVTPRLTAGVST